VLVQCELGEISRWMQGRGNHREYAVLVRATLAEFTAKCIRDDMPQSNWARGNGDATGSVEDISRLTIGGYVPGTASGVVSKPTS
jgi:hypothetical protein